MDLLHVSLPWELEEDILSRLPPQSLVRFRAVSKRWNSLSNDNSFINKQLSLSRPQFIFLTKSKIYSIDIIDQRINLRELHSCCSDLNLRFGTNIKACDELLFCKYPFYPRKVTALWNPWLRQVNWIKLSVEKEFTVVSLGYDNSRPQKVHKLLLYYPKPHPVEVAIYECASQVLRYINTPYGVDVPEINRRPHVSLYGNLYWIKPYDLQTREYFIQSFDFSKEIFKTVCRLPLQNHYYFDVLILAVCKGDRFSLLKQCCETRKTEIWVMENKIDDKEEVVWLHLLTSTASNLPKLFYKTYGVSYFIYDQTLFICCSDDKDKHPCIYIAKGDVCSKIQIAYGRVGWFAHCAYVPNLTSVPLEFQI